MTAPQVFLYVTQKCNIRCTMCYSLDALEQDNDLEFEDMLCLLGRLHDRGSWKLSLLGGEPTRHRQLPQLIKEAKSIGFSFIRIATNGMFSARLLNDPNIQLLDVICFSIDGATSETNDQIRKGGRLVVTLRNLDEARKLGFETRVNTTVNSINLKQLFDIVQLAADHGATEINLNPVLMMGDALRSPLDLGIDATAWCETYEAVRARHHEFPIRIKVPPSFAPTAELAHHVGRGHRCHAADKDRLYVMANGDVFPCLLMMEDKRLRDAVFENGEIRQVTSDLHIAPDLHTYCRFQPLSGHPAELRPLCIFYKTRLNAMPDGTS